jgi:murein L,D-transpeptidase YafK
MNYIVISILILFTNYLQSMGFKEQQMRYSRVRNAYENREAYIDDLLDTLNLQKDDIQIFIRIFKLEQELEVWVRHDDSEEYQLLKVFPICRSSGMIGPKRRQGDLQVPEGLYFIDRFNPSSSYHLSLGINYPNKSDWILADGDDPGGDIFIHGNCVTIGCIPVTDELIEEIYILAVEAKNNDQDTIEVSIFPFKFEESNKELMDSDNTWQLWEQLKKSYNHFEKYHIPPQFTIDENGSYIIH